MNNRLSRFVIAISYLIACICGSAPAAVRAENGEWTSPISLSSQLPGPSQFPKIAADAYGHLHVTWGENSFAESGVADAVYYSRSDGIEWSAPVDVLVSPDQKNVGMGELVYLPTDQLALLWIGAGNLQLSTVAIAEAQRANAWRTTTLFPWLPASKAFMAYSASGDLHAIFIDRVTYEVLYTQSADLGDTWSEPVSVWNPASDAYAADDPRICLDEAGQLIHLVWHENASEQNWNPNGIWYARSNDEGLTWSDAEFLPNRGSSPNCAYDGAGTLHMLWNNAVGSVDGRYHRWSADDGRTWSEPAVIFPGLSGRTRAPALGVDSGGTLHVLNGAYDGATRMFWSYWQGDRWATPEPISGALVSNESPDLVVTEGNLLNGVWHFGYEDWFQVWFATHQTNSPVLSNGQDLVPQPQTNLPDIAATSEPTLQPPPTSSKPAIPTAKPVTTRTSFAESKQHSTTFPPVTWGGLAAFGLVIGFTGVTLLRRRR